MPSIRELRDRKQRESFTGRQAELNTFRRLLMAGESDYAILYLYGVAGIGKSSLLRQFRRIAQEVGYPVAVVDMQVHFSVDEILRSVREQIAQANERALVDFDKGLDMFNDAKSKLQGAVGSLASGVVSGLREGVPLGLGALAVDTVGEEQMKAWLYRHLPRANADLYLHGDRVLTDKLVDGLNRLTAQSGGRHVILFDTFEQSSQAQDDWLRDIFLDSDLSSDVLIVIAGRDPLDGRWDEWHSVLLSRQVRRFTEQEAREYLSQRGITAPALVEAVLSFTERLPWALALVTDISGVHELTENDFAQAPYRHVIGDKLVERFISQVQDDPEMRELVDVCTVVRTFDHDVVQAMWERDAVDGPMSRLRRYSFVHVRADGRWSLNQVVREFLDRSLRRRSSSYWTELNRRAAAFYQESAAARSRYSRQWNWFTLESLYHRLRLDEDEGMSYLSSLFEAAKRFSQYSFCSELLNNVQDIQLTRLNSQHWLTFYQGVSVRMANTLAWDQAHAINQRLYEQPNLPPGLRARVTTHMGRYHYLIASEYEQGIAMLNESLKIRRELNDEQGQADVLSHLAVAQSAAGDFDQGRASGLACIRLVQQLNAPYRLGWGYFSLGVVERGAGNYAAAEDYFCQSLETFEAAGYEFEPGVVHYHIGCMVQSTGDLDAALGHFRLNVQLMRKYDKLALAARTMVDMGELYLAQGDVTRLAAQIDKIETLVLDQGDDSQLARLRLVQAEMALLSETKHALAEAVANHCLDALLAAARVSQSTLLSTVERIETHLERLADQERATLPQTIRQTLIAGVEQALESTLARHGQLVILTERSRQSLRALALAQRWASVGETGPQQ